MYRSFKIEYPHVSVSPTFYNNKVFKSFNLRFGKPRSDTCKVCDSLFIKLKAANSEEERKNIEQESDLHHAKADQGYESLNVTSTGPK